MDIVKLAETLAAAKKRHAPGMAPDSKVYARIALERMAPDLAAEVLRLSALVDELTASRDVHFHEATRLRTVGVDMALANAALVVRVQGAWVLLKGWHDLDNDGTNSGYPATANGTRAWLAGGAE